VRVHTDYLWFNTRQRQEFIRITDDVTRIVRDSGVTEGMVLVSAMHITAAVYVNDWEDGLIHDFQEWLEKLAPAGLPYRHHQTGEDNADAHLKRTLMGHQVVLPITRGKLDLGPWEQVFYAEFDGQRRKRIVVKVMGCESRRIPTALRGVGGDRGSGPRADRAARRWRAIEPAGGAVMSARRWSSAGPGDAGGDRLVVEVGLAVEVFDRISDAAAAQTTRARGLPVPANRRRADRTWPRRYAELRSGRFALADPTR
jgi:secondary thiamine-phosphate synthase enzyme